MFDEGVDDKTWGTYVETKRKLPIAQEKAVIAKEHVDTVRQKMAQKIREAGDDPAKRAKAEAAAEKSIAYAERCANKAEEDAKKAKKRYEKAKGHALPPWHDLELRDRPRIVPPPKDEDEDKDEEEEVKPAKKAKTIN
jgi:hypothetical protein